MSKAPIAAVLGGGLQGCCVALALARRGFAVRLYDRRNALMRGASANQEGKLHLGFVYAADPTLATGRAMIEGSLHFARVIEHLTGRTLNWEPHLSSRFDCVVHRESNFTVDQHRQHFAALQNLYDEVSRELNDVPGPSDLGLSYLGRRPSKLWLDEPEFDERSGSTSFPTEEVAVDPAFVHDVIERVIRQDPAITLCLGRRISEVETRGATLHVGGELCSDGTSFNDPVDLVINCLWEGREAVDRNFGLEDDGPWLTRIKYGFLLDGCLPDTRSKVITHGLFGDVVSFPRARQVYVSWYPACRVALTTDVVPRSWEKLLDGEHDPGRVDAMLAETRAALEPFAPGVSDLPLIKPLAGAIVARGQADIDRASSGLHRRIGEPARRRGNYWSLFTGKYTVAPLQAVRLAEQLEVDVLG